MNISSILRFCSLTGRLNSGVPTGSKWKKNLLTEGRAKSDSLDLLESCFEESPQDRPSSAVELLVRLKNLGQATSKTPQRSAQPKVQQDKTASPARPLAPARSQKAQAEKPAQSREAHRPPAKGKRPVSSNRSNAAKRLAPIHFSVHQLDDVAKFEMLPVPAGKFTMGTKGTPRHVAHITKPYWLSKTPVTQLQWESVMLNQPSKDAGARPDNRPVTHITKTDAKAFCKKLNEELADRIPPGYQFGIPTEAQWEKAARAGSNSDNDIYEFETLHQQFQQNKLPILAGGIAALLVTMLIGFIILGLCGMVLAMIGLAIGLGYLFSQLEENHDKTIEAIRSPYLHPVATAPPNRWGFHNMLGVPWEIVADTFADSNQRGNFNREKYRTPRLRIDPLQISDSRLTLFRGGFMLTDYKIAGRDETKISRSRRGSDDMRINYQMIGFRLAIIPKPDSSDKVSVGN